jgi:hypothetical protein
MRTRLRVGSERNGIYEPREAREAERWRLAWLLPAELFSFISLVRL